MAPAWFNPNQAGEIHIFLEKITHVNILTALPVVEWIPTEQYQGKLL